MGGAWHYIHRITYFHSIPTKRPKIVSVKDLDIVHITNPAEQLELLSIHVTAIADPVLYSYTQRHRKKKLRVRILCSVTIEATVQVRGDAREWW